MRAAIIYTSKHGTTAKVAQMIAGRLTGNHVSIFDLKKVKCPDLNSFDGIILGTSVYAAQAHFLNQHAGNPAVEEFIANQRREAQLYDRYKQYYGYV
ncbi:hypothetical protein EZS27_030338, partial [termite gut metagenome]